MKNNDVYTIITSRIIKLIEQGDIPWQKPWGGSNSAPTNFISGKPYRGVNVWLLGSLKYDSPYWLTFKQAQTRGGHVRKGEKAAPVMFWKQYDRKDAEGETHKTLVARYYNVFNLSQIEGIDAPQEDAEHTSAIEPIAACQALYDEWEDAPRVRHGFSGAFYTPSTDAISMPNFEQFHSAEEYYSTLFHEMTHATGHPSRLARPTLVDMVRFGDTNYSKEELVAEMGASFLCGHASIENRTIDNSAAYIQHWLRKLRDDSRLFVQAAAQAQKAIDLILGV